MQILKLLRPEVLKTVSVNEHPTGCEPCKIIGNGPSTMECLCPDFQDTMGAKIVPEK
jgi:hypothetical protein